MYEQLDWQDKEELITSGTPPSPILPPQDMALHARLCKMSVASSHSKAPIDLHPILSPMPITPPPCSPCQPEVQILLDDQVTSAVGPTHFINMVPPNELAPVVLPASDTPSFHSQQSVSPSVQANDFMFEAPPSHVLSWSNSINSQALVHHSKASLLCFYLSLPQCLWGLAYPTEYVLELK